jgi:hypothetical protein
MCKTRLTTVALDGTKSGCVRRYQRWESWMGLRVDVEDETNDGSVGWD